MARFFRSKRIQALAESRFGRYLAYATGEIVLIFLGITLALWFSNWNEQLRLRDLERATLGEISANLRANAETIRNNIDQDRSSLADCETILELMDRRTAWTSEHSLVLYNCRTWTSPYFQDAAYESLRLRGTELISDSDVRNSIINLHENVYEFLVSDTDGSQWSFEASVWGPIYARYIEHGGPQNTKPTDYEGFVKSADFRNALIRHTHLLEVSVRHQADALNSTRQTLDLIETMLDTE